MKLKPTSIGILFTAAILIISLGFSLYAMKKPTELSLSANPAENVDMPMVSLEEAFPYVLAPNSTLFTALRALEVPPATIQQIVDAAKPVQNLATLPAGIRFQVFRDKTTSEINGLQFHFSAIESVDIRKESGTWGAKKLIEKVDLKTVTFSGTVTSSLWESAQRAEMDPNLIAELADIFAFEVDFSREVRANDRWRLTVEQKLVKGKPIGWGAILAAEYNNTGTPYYGVLFRLDGKDMGYFTPEGSSLRKMFLKSPLRYGRITSGFSRKRFHPVLQTFRAHRGVDYGVPVGTPVRAVGDGIVTFAQHSGGGGRVLKIRHNSVYQTAYKHLSGFGQGVRNGVRVQQGQVVAYSGNTGLSTGPHLHFEFYQNGAFVDPLSKKFPSADPVPKQHLSLFKSQATSLLATLPVWEEQERVPASVSKDLTTEL